MKKTVIATLVVLLFGAVNATAQTKKTRVEDRSKTTTSSRAGTTSDSSTTGSTGTPTTTPDTSTTMNQGSTAQDTSLVTTTEDSDSKISKGGFYIEPLIFASREDASVKTSQLPFVSDDTSGNANGYGIGVRFGGHISEIFLLGLDARYSKVRMDDSAFDNADADVYNVAPAVAIQTPLWGLRVLGSYVVAGENNPGSGSQGIDLKFKEATGWRLGAGLHIAMVSVNLEYQDLTYNKTDVESFGAFAANSSTDVDMDSKGYTLSVGFPIEL